MAEVSKVKTAPKAAAKRKPAVKKVAAKKPAARKAAPKKAAKKSTVDFGARAQETGRNAFLASLGFYGKAFDQVQEQFSDLQDQLAARRKKTNKLYTELVKRGVDKSIIQKWIDDSVSELPLVFDGMPLQDAVDFANFAVNLVIGRFRFGMGTPTCGGAVDIAVIRPNNFDWAQRKRWSIK